MGKKNKTVNAMTYKYDKPKEWAALKERYGVEGAQGGKPSNYGPGSERRDEQDVYNDIMSAAQNDYDTRRSIEAAAMSGKKKAQGWAEGGLNNIDDVAKANNMFEKMHRRRGNGGDFTSASDYAGLTHSLVQRDRAKQTAAYDKTYAKTTDLNDLKDKLMAQATDKAAGSTPIEPSDRMAAVEERLEGAASNRPPSLFDKDNAQPAKADDQKDAARSFLNDYKLDVAEGANIKSDIETGVSNAAKHVRDTYGR